MSTKYNSASDVPTELLCNRLEELSNIIANNFGKITKEFSISIPAECDKDADIILREAARRLRSSKNDGNIEESSIIAVRK